tara:strand:- start:54 stop:320 length:267 start_codon:yes stop_codon:yes gene_type:complete
LTVNPEHDKITSQQRRENMGSLTDLYGKDVVETLKELQFILDVAQQEGLGASPLDRNQEISLEVKIKHAAHKLIEAMTEYDVVRCHEL